MNAINIYLLLCVISVMPDHVRLLYKLLPPIKLLKSEVEGTSLSETGVK